LSDFRKEFNWAIDSLLDRLQEQGEYLAAIEQSLQGITAILKTPTETQAREFCRRAYLSSRNGWFDEALADFRKAIALSPTDYLAHLGLGRLAYYGDSAAKNVDLLLAEKHFSLAAKYAKGFDGDSAKQDGIQAMLLLARTYYCLSSECKLRGDIALARKYLEQAALKAQEGGTRASIYLRAKCYALLDRSEEAILDLAWCADFDRSFVFQAVKDEDFSAIKNEIAKIPRQLREQPEFYKFLSPSSYTIAVVAELESLSMLFAEQMHLDHIQRAQRDALKSRFDRLADEANWGRMDDLFQGLRSIRSELSEVKKAAVRSFQDEYSDILRAIDRRSKQKWTRPKLIELFLWMCTLAVPIRLTTLDEGESIVLPIFVFAFLLTFVFNFFHDRLINKDIRGMAAQQAALKRRYGAASLPP
jgi:hypothetical protein